MSRVSKSDKLKTKPAEAQAGVSDVTPNRKLPSKPRTLKSSSNLNEKKAVSNEKETANKLENAPKVTSKKTKIVAPKNLDRNIIARSSQAHKLGGTGSVSSTSQGRCVSLRAKQLSKTTVKPATMPHKTVKAMTEKKSITQKKNAVLDTPHNVTVTSPPSKRKNGANNIASSSNETVDTSKLIRRGSRTLAVDEIVVLKRESAKMRSEQTIRKEALQMDAALAADKKESVAFEVKFDEKLKKPKQVCKGMIGDGVGDVKQRTDEEAIYSDDFESYESDFETGSSTKSLLTSDSLSDENPIVSDDSEQHESDTQVTERHLLEVQIDKESKLDSGNYDTSLGKINAMKPSDPTLQSSQRYPDNWEHTSLGISEQMDSGISTTGATFVPFSSDTGNVQVIYGGYRHFYEKPIISSRGCELRTKIQFDVLSFTLIELKPISYEIFMQTFGQINTNQNFTQTQENQMNAEQQTEIHATRSCWTQHPPELLLEKGENCYKNRRVCEQLFCGDDLESSEDQSITHCELEQNLNAIKQLKIQSSKREYQNYHNRLNRPIKYQELHSFLLRSSFVIDQILGSSKTNTKSNATSDLAAANDEVLKRVCERSFYMKSNFLNMLRVIKIFSNHKLNLLVTVHESLPDTNVYSGDFSNLLMVWCTNTCEQPLRLLTTWSEVSKVEIPSDSSDIVVAALRDGSIALWDLKETHSFCSKLDGYLTHFAATQSIVPSTVERGINKIELDLGACLDVKSFRNTAGNVIVQPTFPKTQFVSLHESGIVTVWTLVTTSEITFDLMRAEHNDKVKCSTKFAQMFDSLSPWARVKLMQSSIVNIKKHVETKSARSQSRFDKTKDFFQKNIYSDESLRELSNSTPEVGRQGIRFTSLECGSENVFICTNRNFVLMCSKTLKMNKLKRIFIDDGSWLFPTALKLLNNERFLAVGLCNGVVKILNCQSGIAAKCHKEMLKKSEMSQSFDDAQRDRILNNSLTSKSCAIQNILLNVEKSCEKMDLNGDYRPSTAACMTLIDSDTKPFELKIFDQQVIISGSALRKNLIQNLELSSDGWYLFALANGRLRMYDFYLEQELVSEELPEHGGIIDLATGKCGCKENNLMILRPNTEIEVIILKQQ